jgi:hypothetical protein
LLCFVLLCSRAATAASFATHRDVQQHFVWGPRAGIIILIIIIIIIAAILHYYYYYYYYYLIINTDTKKMWGSHVPRVLSKLQKTKKKTNGGLRPPDPQSCFAHQAWNLCVCTFGAANVEFVLFALLVRQMSNS